MQAPDARRASSRAPILVTGLQRGGTTWVGRMIGARAVVRRNSLAGDDRASYARESIVRDSRRNLLRWRENLRSSSIERIRDLTADYWLDFYEPEDW